MTDLRRREIASWHFDLGQGWYPVQLDVELDNRDWALRAVEAVRNAAADPGIDGDIVAELTDLRAALLTRGGAVLQACVYIRPEAMLTIGCVATGDVLTLDDDDDITSFEAMLRAGFDQPAPGVRTMDSLIWRDSAGAGEILGAYQRYDIIEVGEALGTAYQRILYGIFPEHCREMVELDFTTADLAAFVNMREETTELVRSITIETEEAS